MSLLNKVTYGPLTEGTYQIKLISYTAAITKPSTKQPTPTEYITLKYQTPDKREITDIQFDGPSFTKFFINPIRQQLNKADQHITVQELLEELKTTTINMYITKVIKDEKTYLNKNYYQPAIQTESDDTEL